MVVSCVISRFLPSYILDIRFSSLDILNKESQPMNAEEKQKQEWRDRWNNGDVKFVPDLFDALSERDREVDRLKQDHKAYKETSEEIHQSFINKHNEWFKLYEENQRLRKALETIAQAEKLSMEHSTHYMQYIARQALAGEEK
jgi:hypothetical protein